MAASRTACLRTNSYFSDKNTNKHNNGDISSFLAYNAAKQTWLMSETKLPQSDLDRSSSRRMISCPDNDDADMTCLLSITASFSFKSPSSLICSALCHVLTTTTIYSQCRKSYKENTFIRLLFNRSNFLEITPGSAGHPYWRTRLTWLQSPPKD